MKNILAENMLRFGPKNLSGASKKKLQRLAEAEEQNAKGGRVSITTLSDVLAASKTGPTTIKSSNPDDTVITFPSSGEARAGEDAINVGQGKIYHLAGSGGGAQQYYLVVGNFGPLDNSLTKINGTSPKFKIVYFAEATGWTDATKTTIQDPDKPEGNTVVTVYTSNAKFGYHEYANIAKKLYPQNPIEGFIKSMVPKLNLFAEAAKAYGFVWETEPVAQAAIIKNQIRPLLKQS